MAFLLLGVLLLILVTQSVRILQALAASRTAMFTLMHAIEASTKTISSRIDDLDRRLKQLEDA